MPKDGQTSIELVKKYLDERKLQKNQEFKKTEVFSWFEKNYPNKFVNGTIYCTLIKFSVNAKSRKHHYPDKDGKEDILYQIDSGTFRLYDKTDDGIILPPDDQIIDDDDIVNTGFAYEKDLQNFLIKNLSIIEHGLRLYEEDGVSGVEYPVNGRFIDILAIDKDDNFVIFELKVSKGYDRVVGQLLRYKNWIKMNLVEGNQKVRGVIICKEITEDLILACMDLNDIELFEYELSFKLNKK